MFVSTGRQHDHRHSVLFIFGQKLSAGVPDDTSRCFGVWIIRYQKKMCSKASRTVVRGSKRPRPTALKAAVIELLFLSSCSL